MMDRTTATTLQSNKNSQWQLHITEIFTTATTSGTKTVRLRLRLWGLTKYLNNNFCEVICVLCCYFETGCLLLGRWCCVSFEYLREVKPLHNMLLLFAILYFERMNCYSISTLKDFCITFVDFNVRVLNIVDWR